MEVAAAVSGDLPEHEANESFLRLLDASNPDYTGWPVWVDSRGFRDDDAHPYVFDGAWEAFIWSTRHHYSAHLDFWRLDPRGRFYLLRALQDDLVKDKLEPLKHLDFGLVVLRVAEAIAVALEFAKAMGASADGDDGAQVAFAFRWWGLENRVLSSWANAGRYISPGRRCMQSEVLAEISVPLDTPLSAIAGYVKRVVAKVFAVFDGFELSENVIEDLVERLLNRRL